MNRFIVRIGFAAVLVVGFGLTGASGQGPQLTRVMRGKLEQSQGLLAALVTSNWSDLERRSRALEALTRDPAWAVMNAPEYVRHAAVFLRAAQDLTEAAARRDLEGAPLAYVSLTLSCVRCHQAVARARLADRRGSYRSDQPSTRNSRLPADSPLISTSTR
jgi:hypothetical protein